MDTEYGSEGIRILVLIRLLIENRLIQSYPTELRDRISRFDSHRLLVKRHLTLLRLSLISLSHIRLWVGMLSVSSPLSSLNWKQDPQTTEHLSIQVSIS
jgi:hypothetical protein